MTLEEMKLAVCEKMPKDSIFYQCLPPQVKWPTEGLQVCHEAEKLLEADDWYVYDACLPFRNPQHAHATYEQRLEALCRVWFPEKFTP